MEKNKQFLHYHDNVAVNVSPLEHGGGEPKIAVTVPVNVPLGVEEQLIFVEVVPMAMLPVALKCQTPLLQSTASNSKIISFPTNLRTITRKTLRTFFWNVCSNRNRKRI